MVKLNWQAPFDGNSKILYFTVRYSSSGEEIRVNISSTDLVFMAENLLPATTYLFQVTATNRLGTSEAASVSVTTREAGQWVELALISVAMKYGGLKFTNGVIETGASEAKIHQYRERWLAEGLRLKRWCLAVEPDDFGAPVSWHKSNVAVFAGTTRQTAALWQC